MSVREFRFTGAAKELRVQQTDKGKMISGYAAVYNSRSLDLGGFVEQIVPGAFRGCLAARPDVSCLHEHDPKQGLLGRSTSGTLRLSSDDTGLAFECDLPNTTLGNDLAESINRGDVSGCSFGFYCLNDTWEELPAGAGMLRSVLEAQVFDVTITSMPAYEATSVGLRSRMFPDGGPAGKPAGKPAKRDAGEAQDGSITVPEFRCGCSCAGCVSGACDDCTNDDCDDPLCKCSEDRSNKLLAAVIERRLRF